MDGRILRRKRGQNAWLIFGITLIFRLPGLTAGYTGGVIPILLVITIAGVDPSYQRRRPAAILSCKLR